MGPRRVDPEKFPVPGVFPCSVLTWLDSLVRRCGVIAGLWQRPTAVLLVIETFYCTGTSTLRGPFSIACGVFCSIESCSTCISVSGCSKRSDFQHSHIAKALRAAKSVRDDVVVSQNTVKATFPIHRRDLTLPSTPPESSLLVLSSKDRSS